MWVFPMVAAVVAAVFAGVLAQRWLASHRPHNIAWSLALLMFAIASFAAAIGVLDRWTEMWFRAYYYFGAVMNVPVLALGTIYLLLPRSVGHVSAVLVAIGGIFAAGVVFGAGLDTSALAVEGIPRAGEVISSGNARSVSRFFSFGGYFVVVFGALWSAWKMTREDDGHLRRLAKGNVLIAVGTTVAAVASILARFGQGAVFSVGILIAIVLMFWGFLTTRAKAPEAPEDGG